MAELHRVTIDGVEYDLPSGGQHTYSTEEQVVGTWIDGKPVYEKIIDVGNNYVIYDGSSAFGIEELNELKIDQFIEASFILNANDYRGVIIPLSAWNLNGEYRYTGFSKWNAQSGRYVSLYIKYTKTTD